MDFMTMYAKIEPDKVKFNQAHERDFNPNTVSPKLAEFYSKFFRSLSFSSPHGTILLYPVRILEVYIVTVNNEESVIYSSNRSLYNFLKSLNSIVESPELRKQFAPNKFLDFDQIAALTGATINCLPIKQYMVDEKDVITRNLDSTGLERSYFIPCLHENKVIYHEFLRTSTISPEKKRKLRKKKFKKVRSAYNIPYEIHKEFFKGVAN